MVWIHILGFVEQLLGHRGRLVDSGPHSCHVVRLEEGTASQSATIGSDDYDGVHLILLCCDGSGDQASNGTLDHGAQFPGTFIFDHALCEQFRSIQGLADGGDDEANCKSGCAMDDQDSAQR